MIKRSIYVFLGVLSILGFSQITSGIEPEPRLKPEQIDAVVERALEVFDVPGISIAVVQKGHPVYLKGYGVESIETNRPVSTDSLFGIGSTSKAFTTTAIALLADQGKLNWDDRVIDHIPEFRMYDEWVTREFTVRDLVTHRSGLPPFAGDLIMLTQGKATKANVYRALANFKPATSFRTEYAYDNLLYVVAGDLIERVSGMSWEAFIEQSILQPLEMDGCVADQKHIPKKARLSRPHDSVDQQLEVVEFSLPELTKPAGGIFCNPPGMAKWMEFNLGIDARNLKLSAPGFIALSTPVTPLEPGSLDSIFGQTQFANYALGWFVQDSYGTKEVQHAGGLPGMVTQLSIFPKEGLGIVVLSNKSSSAAHAIVNQLLEETFSSTPQDAIQLYAMLAERQEQTKRLMAESAASSSTASGMSARPALALSSYAGTYRDAWFGDVVVSLNDDILSIDLGSKDLSADLEHVGGDLFAARWHNSGLNADAYVQFSPDVMGNIVGATMQPISVFTDSSYDFRHLKLDKLPTP